MQPDVRPAASLTVSTPRPIRRLCGRARALFLVWCAWFVPLAAGCSAADGGGPSLSSQGDGGFQDPSSGAQGMPATETPGAGGTTKPCPTCADDFLPSIDAPVCSHCHGSDPGPPNLGCVFSGVRVVSAHRLEGQGGHDATAQLRPLVVGGSARAGRCVSGSRPLEYNTPACESERSSPGAPVTHQAKRERRRGGGALDLDEPPTAEPAHGGLRGGLG
jgi:hypothetical protein